MQNKSPKVSVITPVYNAGPHLAETIQSVLDQTFDDFEYILCDDGSTDNSMEVARSFEDPRIRIISNAKNLGSAATRNRLIDESVGEYCAILDADDLMLPERLQIQVNFLDSHPEVDFCSGAVVRIDANGNETGVRLYAEEMTHSEIAVRALFTCTIAQTTVMFRREQINHHDIRYIIRKNGADDMAFFNIAIEHVRFHNLPNTLTKYRSWDGNMSANINQRQHSNALETMLSRYNRLGIDMDQDNIAVLKGLHTFTLKRDQMPDFYSFAIKLFSANEKTGLYDTNALRKYIRHYHNHYRREFKSQMSWLERQIFSLQERSFRKKAKSIFKPNETN